MRKTLAIAAMAGSVAFAGLALSPASAQAATQSATQSATASASTAGSGNWGKFFSSDRKAYTFGKTWKSGGKVFTKWNGVDKRGGKKGWVWFEYYQNGSWHKFNRSWDGKTVGSWSGRGIKKVYTFTCWAGKFDNCGRKYRIY
ncbi:hypothetical protein [Nonomuraea jiangxiensis]|uniref:Uncharacterized protein n=1 Tax=Nonomuraea jiangxiensis TaxID=633440 RepID=A0A1G7ZC81_9ACTN|nr:hypothetical protein [Nonomuraea jiangxiensis]SDH06363.1 hypothetical protein SAMN05421869_101375 [Nonomuraea jiangxiensis]